MNRDLEILERPESKFTKVSVSPSGLRMTMKFTGRETLDRETLIGWASWIEEDLLLRKGVKVSMRGSFFHGKDGKWHILMRSDSRLTNFPYEFNERKYET